MKNNSLISIIIANHNNADYLPDCLVSVLNQSYQEIEVIVIDDRSTDSSRDILYEHSKHDPRLKLLFNENNLGVSASRDRGIIQSKGNYITTLDSDDIFIRPDKLQNEMSLIQTSRKAGEKNIIAFSDIVLIDKSGHRLNTAHRPPIKENNIFHDILIRSCFIPRDFLFTKKQYQESGRFDKSVPMYEDWDLKIRLAHKNLFKFTGKEGVGYRRHGSGLSSVSPLRHLKYLNRVFWKNIKRVHYTQLPRTFSSFYLILYRVHGRSVLHSLRSR